MESAEDLEAFLAATLLFAELPAAARAALAREVTRVALAKGDILFEAGTPGDAAFVVRSGLVHVRESTAVGARLLDEVARAGHVGEMAALTGEPRAAAAVAAMESILYQIPGATLRALFREHPTLHTRLSLGLMRNLQRRAAAERLGARTCAFVAAGAAVGIALDLAGEIAACMTELGGGRVAVVDCTPGTAAAAQEPLPDDLGDLTRTLRRLLAPAAGAGRTPATVVQLGRDVAADAPIAALIAELRHRYDRVILYAALPWTDAVAHGVSQCDGLYWVVNDGDSAAVHTCRRARAELAARVRVPPAQRMLRLVRASGPPSAQVGADGEESRAIVGADGGAARFEAPEGRRALRAVAREILARRSALVLGAGGAKGFAHVGALRAFERHGVEFDAIVGTSIGGVVGALVSIGWAAADIERLLTGIAASPWRALFDVRLPTDAFFGSRKKTELIALHCGDRRIEDCAIPFFTVAGDLISLATVVFHTGSLTLALDATSAIPTVFRPVRSDGRLLVDGWVCDPLPADVARSAGYERVVAIDLSPRPTRGPVPRRPSSSASQGFHGRLRILAIAMRTIELASQEHVARSLPLIDVLIRPGLDEYTSSDLAAAAVMCERGERAAEAALAEIRGSAAFGSSGS
jgi:NTE family protein